VPLSLASLEVRTNNYRVKGTILLDLYNLVDMIKVVSEILVSRIVARPIPSIVDLRPRELILRNFGVDRCTGVAVPAPCATEIIAGFEDDGLEATVTKGLEHVYSS
jgi:hypothetical protein